ncbi:MAG: FAD/NAD(P)-binding protein [Fimbriimonadaceae bacterium]|nr:FAD/NAD(P)-binding protein [Fimbriimonadaceae bacterium]
MRIAIIGGGAAGALTAIHLRQAGVDDVTVYDPAERVGPGVAYAPGSPAYRLNVPAARLSVDPAHPADFAEFAQIEWTAFAPRDVYGEYLHRRFAQSGARHTRATVERLTELTSDAHTGIILALGAGPPRWPHPMPIAPANRLDSVWHAAAVQRIPADSAVAILGTGLSMMDATLQLLQQGHAGPITAISRTGRLPMPHGPAEPVSYNGENVFAFLRGAAADGNWRGRMDALRPVTQRMWQRMSWPQRRQWLGHARSLWDRYRHRSPADAHAEVTAAISTGRVRIVTGDVRRPNPVLAESLRTADLLLNASGPDYHLASRNLPVINSLLATTDAAYDPLGMGLMVDDDGRVLGAQSERGPGVWTLGALAVGCRWETTAIPEIRAQAMRIAELLADSPSRE